MEKKFEIVEQAMRIAMLAHEGQVRKNDKSPYIIHPLMVGMMLIRYGFSDIVIAAGITHDVLEDTDVTEELLRGTLGDAVVDIVTGVTEDNSLEWEERKKGYVELVRASSEDVKAVSLGDKIHNLKSLLNTYDVEGASLWEKFSRGKEKKVWFEVEMLTMFRETWNHPLVDEYEELVERMKGLEG